MTRPIEPACGRPHSRGSSQAGWRQRHRRSVLLFQQDVSLRGLFDFAENLRHRPIASLDLIRIAIDEDGDDLLVGGDETFQPVLPQIDLLVRLDDIVVVVDEFLDEFECARALADLAEKKFTGRARPSRL